MKSRHRDGHAPPIPAQKLAQVAAFCTPDGVGSSPGRARRAGARRPAAYRHRLCRTFLRRRGAAWNPSGC
ncbi:hypothetical protein GZL_06764 [Streptomyces sp. 769]|nr:hypothetical protein GZL_06764 [Streptomyces sp. 769]